MRIATTLTMTPAGRTIGKGYVCHICQFLLHFITYFPNVSYVNSERPRTEGCSNEGKKKAGQEAGRKEGGN